MSCNIDANKIQKLREELSYYDREVYNASDLLSSIKDTEIVALEKILDEQTNMIHALKTEKEAFQRHGQILEA